MASALYPKYKELILGAGLNLTSLTIKCVLIDTADYTYDPAHDFLADVPAGARVGTPQTLGTKSITGGVFDALDCTFGAVTGDATEAVIIYNDTGDEATSNLIAYIEGAVTPNGGDIIVQWDNGANKIFAL